MLIYIKSFYLVKKAMRPGADGFITVNTSGTYYPDRKFTFFHFADLHIAGMCAQQPIRVLMNIKCILHITGRMMFRKIERCKIVPVIFNLRAFCNNKSQSFKHLDDPVFHQADGMP